ncbi:signal peptidase complex subunit 2 [Cunninghamella echinulata]|nr:signal peptidase complex subunit 2 [Cunninghamella echinulata]
MSEGSNTTTLEKEPVQISNVYDSTQIKHALDDELSKFIEKELGYSQSHQHTDVKLVLGYISCFIALGSFLYEKKHDFQDCKWGTLGCVVAFWVLQTASWLYTKFVQKEETFVGYLYKDKQHVGTLSVTTILEQYSSEYKIKYLYTDENKQKHTRSEEVKNVASYFTENGTLVEDKLNTDIKLAIQKLTASLHQD